MKNFTRCWENLNKSIFNNKKLQLVRDQHDLADLVVRWAGQWVKKAVNKEMNFSHSKASKAVSIPNRSAPLIQSTVDLCIL